jgi:hypothetical protein
VSGATRHVWPGFRTVAICLSSTISAAYCFTHYFSASLVYSGQPPSPEREAAGLNALVFFGAFLLLEALSARAVGVFFFDSPDLGSAPLRFASRYGGGLIISLVLTALELGIWALVS